MIHNILDIIRDFFFFLEDLERTIKLAQQILSTLNS